MTLSKNYTHFTNRKERAAFIAKRFEKYISEAHSILDVGCDDNTLKHIVGSKVIGIDLYGTPDHTVDLEKDQLSRFADNECDLVICTEVLEHLESFYPMIDELTRVAGKHVLISLPNCFDLITKYNILFHNKAGKFYGLPLTPPKDRHRWIFGWQDLDAFFRAYCKKNDLIISENFLHFNFSESLKGRIGRVVTDMLNIYSASQSYWIIISKK
jgi:hypothetical protein